MFPVPQHLPRTGGEHISSSTPQPDPVLDLLQPLIPSSAGSAILTSPRVKDVRASLEKAVDDNKARTHDLVISNFPSISSHIQLSTQLRSDVSDVQARLSSLERKVDPSDIKTSFLPPLLTTLNRHYTASSSRSSAQAHTKALKALSTHTERLRKLEDAVWCGRGADDWVVNSLTIEEGYSLDEDVREGEGILQGTKIRRDIEAKDGTLKSMVIEQIIDGYHKAVVLSTATRPQSGVTLSVQANVTLQQPKSARPNHISETAITPYPLSEIYHALSRLDLLTQLLSNLSSKILKDLVHPVVSSRQRVNLSSTESLSILRLEPVSNPAPSDVLNGVKTILEYVSSSVFPPSSVPERESFLAEITSSAFRLILDNLILHSMPSSLSGVQAWLEVLHNSVQVESSFSPEHPVVKSFFDTEAGLTWAQQRRYAVSDEVRKLILSGWGGWEGSSKEKERETVVYIEVEVEDPNVPEPEPASKEDTKMDEDEFGWGFEEKETSSKPETAKIDSVPPEAAKDEDTVMADDGWGFDEPETTAAPVAGPSSPSKPSLAVPALAEEADGWDLDPPARPASPVKPAIASKPVKPAREAKRLGKKVAKVKADDDYDPWGSGAESAVESTTSTSGSLKLGRNGHSSSSRSVSPPVPQTPAAPAPADDGWGWEDDAAAAPSQPAGVPASLPKSKRKEIREEKRIVKERYLVSDACERLISIARGVLADVEELEVENTFSSSPSFASASLEPVLHDAVSEVFVLYRALLPTHFAKQLLDVPSLAMQAYNDTLYLSSVLPSLGLTDEQERLVALGEYIFETQLDSQRAALLEALVELDGLQATGDDKVFHRAERGLKGVVHNLESLARVIKPVLTPTKALEIVSYLCTTLISNLTTYVLELGDITEVESNRLTELFKLVYPLEKLFAEPSAEAVADGGSVVLHVGGWLKFCYISEILQASLVDITYLLDSGSLVDFTPSELAGLVRALFASSEKRDGVVDRIERDGTGTGTGAGTGVGV